MSAWCTLGGERVQSGNLSIPMYGAMAGDVLLASSTQVDEQTTLVIGDVSLVVHVVRQASFAGSRGYRLVAGYGGWRKRIGPRYYAAPASLPLATVLRDVAAEIGEQVDVPADRLIGTCYARSNGPASRVLEQLAPDWWIAPDGMTHVGPRDGAPITTPLTVIVYSGAQGKFQIATETMADWLPGRTFTSPTISAPVTIGAVQIAMGNDGKVRLEILSVDASGADRLSEPLDQIIESRIPALAYLVPWECTIVNVHGSGPWTLDVVPTSASCPLPGMTTLGTELSMPGLQVKPAVDATCLVQFINGDPQRPYVSAFDSTQIDEMDLNGGSDVTIVNPLRHIVRWGDSVAGLGSLVPQPLTNISKVQA